MTEQAPRVIADETISAARTKKIICAITGRELPASGWLLLIPCGRPYSTVSVRIILTCRMMAISI